MVCLVSFLKTEFFVLFPVKCSVTCGSGIMTRSVECSDKDVSCDARTKPPTSAPCGLEPCPQWTVGSWGKVNIHIDFFGPTNSLDSQIRHISMFSEIFGLIHRVEEEFWNRDWNIVRIPYLLVKKWKIEHPWTFCSRHTVSLFKIAAMIRVRYMPPHFTF